jgi:imidazoleglycerol-phosphate dehydratase
MSTLTRETKETRVRAALDSVRPTDARPDVATGDEFLDHMLITLGRYARLRLMVEAAGDLQHHLIEDVAITLGTVLGRDTPATCARYGDATVPMDEALVQVVVDAGGRPHYEGGLPSDLYEHFFRSLALNARWTVHVRVVRGGDRHHVVEAAFKALGLAARRALDDDGAVFSTKGSVQKEWAPDLDEARELGPVPPGSPDSEAGGPAQASEGSHRAG